MSEIHTPDKFPGIKWAQSFINPQDKDRDFTPGIIQVTAGNLDYKLNREGQLVISETHPLIHSRVRFGIPGITNYTFRSIREKPFSLEDPNRINDASASVSGMITTLHQLETTVKVERAGEELIRALHSGVGYYAEEHLQDIGVLAEILNKYKKDTATARLLTHAQKAYSLGVVVFYEGSSAIGGGITWTTNELIQNTETGHCPPLPVERYLV